MSENVMLILIGGRSAVPAISGALQFLDKIDRVKFLLCNGSQYLTFQKNVEKVLKQEKEFLRCDSTDISVVDDPSKFDAVYTAVKELCTGVTNLKYINLTTVPQTMAISVYSYVKDNYKNAVVFTVNTDQSQIIPLSFGEQSISFNKQLTVDNYVAMCGLNIFKKKSPNKSNYESIAKYLVDHVERSNKVLSVIRQEAGGGDTAKTPKGFRIDSVKFTKLGIQQDDLKSFLNYLQQAQLISRLEISTSQICFRIETDDNYAFLAGGWLEVFVYFAAKNCKFDSIEMGVETDNYRGEVDVFCLKSGNAMICECKTGKFNSEDLSTLGSKAEKLGGKYCVKLFIASDCEINEKFRNQAHNNRVVIVSGSKLSEISDILIKEMQNPTYPRT